MAIKVSTQSTLVKKIKLGRPVRRVTEAPVTLAGLNEVSISNPTDGEILIYESSSGKWKNKILLDKQDISGGQY